MSDQIRCPMCGKPNPADAEICQYCHARLTPLQAGEPPRPESLPFSENPPRPAAADASAADDRSQAAEEDSALPPLGDTSEQEDELLWTPNDDEDLPEWLKSLGEEEEEGVAPSPPSPSETTTEAAPEEEGALPDWLASEENQPPSEEAPLPGEEEAASLPDWLSSPSPSETTPEAAPEEEGALPDWLASEETPSPSEEAPLPGEEEAASLPDWLSSPSPSETTPETAPEEEGALPDWLASEETPTSSEETSAAEEPLPEPSSPSEPVVPQPFLAVEDILPEDLLQETPDWLASLVPEEEAAAPESSAPTAAFLPDSEAPSIEPAELPAWIEALRPIEAPPPSSTEEEKVETRGPLAGLRGVLTPPDSRLIQAGRVAPIGGRLFLTNEQEQHVALLREMLEGEFTPSPAPKPSNLTPQRVLRWFIGVALLAIAFLPFILPTLQAPPPNRILPAAQAALEAIDAVPQNAPVLIGVDYSPAFSAEMETAATPLLGDLLAQKARLTIVSTQPTGPALATHLLARAWNGTPAQEGEQYLNLGYLPGGTAGLYAFAQNPRAVFAYNAGHPHLWESPFLKDIHHLSDFALVIVITEDADTARAWVEQVRPMLDPHTPLVAVISAQAEPMVEPYYETASHQIAGVVTGMAGSMAYRAVRGQQPAAPLREQWNSYSYTVLFAALLIAAAGLYNLALGWKEAYARRLVAEEDEATLEEEEA